MSVEQLATHAVNILDWISVPGSPLNLPPGRLDPAGETVDATDAVTPVLLVAVVAIRYAAEQTGTDEAAVIFDLRTILDRLATA